MKTNNNSKGQHTYSKRIKRLRFDSFTAPNFRCVSSIIPLKTRAPALDRRRIRIWNYALEDINFPENLKSIGETAFIVCKSLKKVEIPASVQYIGQNAFAQCTAVEDVYLYRTDFGDCSFSTDAFSTISHTTLHIYYFIDPDGLTQADGSVYNWYNDNPASVVNDIYLPGYHRVITDGIIGGTVEAAPYVEEGETVTFTVSPDEGFIFESAWANDGAVTLTENTDGSYSFEMPALDVVITAEFSTADGYYEVVIEESENGKVMPDKWAAREGDTVTLTAYPDIEYELDTLTVDGGQISTVPEDDGSRSFTMPDRNVPVTASFKYVFEHGTDEEGTFYIIRDSRDWEKLAAYVGADRDRHTMRFLLADDIETSVMVGGEDHPFESSFDGGGHSITVDYADDGEENASLFRSTRNATIRSLQVAGSIRTSRNFAAGFIGTAGEYTLIEDCRSSVTISSTVSGDGTHGGLIGRTLGYSPLTMTGCVFDGMLLGESTSHCGGLVGWSDEITRVTNSVFAPTGITVSAEDSSTISRGMIVAQATESYYLSELGDNYTHAARAYGISAADDDITIDFEGESTSSYDTAGLSFYGGGFKLDDACYSAPGREHEMNLTYTGTGRGNSIHASAGELIHENGAYRLVMPAEDVVLHSKYTITSDSMPTHSSFMNLPGAAEEGDMFAPVMLMEPDAWNEGLRPEAVLVTDSQGNMTEITKNAEGGDLLSADAPTGSNGKREIRVGAFAMPGSDVTVSARFAFTGPGTWKGLQARLILGGTITLARDITADAGDTALTVPAGVTGATIAVEFASDNTLRITFKLGSKKTADDFTFLLDGTEKKPRVIKSAACLEVENIAAPNLDTVHTFTVMDGTDAYTVSASALSYALTSIRNGTPERQNLGKALFLYNQAANAWFDN